MLARVTTLQGAPGKVEEGILSFREQVLPAARRLDGFKGAYLLVDRKRGRALGITLWETEKALQASTATADRLRAQVAQTTGATAPPTVEVYEVAVQP